MLSLLTNSYSRLCNVALTKLYENGIPNSGVIPATNDLNPNEKLHTECSTCERSRGALYVLQHQNTEYGLLSETTHIFDQEIYCLYHLPDSEQLYTPPATNTDTDTESTEVPSSKAVTSTQDVYCVCLDEHHWYALELLHEFVAGEDLDLKGDIQQLRNHKPYGPTLLLSAHIRQSVLAGTKRMMVAISDERYASHLYDLWVAMQAAPKNSARSRFYKQFDAIEPAPSDHELAPPTHPGVRIQRQ